MIDDGGWELAGRTLRFQKRLAEDCSPTALAELEQVNRSTVWGFQERPETALAYVRRAAAELADWHDRQHTAA